jgi:hypothetical protein
MMHDAKISSAHRQRMAVVYVRQSSPTQLERNRESTLRQYNFVARAIALGWSEAQIHVIDEDQGVSASGLFDRAGFAQLTAEVALGTRWHCPWAGSCQASSEQCRLVPFTRPVRTDQHGSGR